jgi:hypothetical protein
MHIAKAFMTRSLLLLALLLAAIAPAQAGPVEAVQDATLRLLADGQTVCEVVALPAADLQRLKAWLKDPDASTIASSGASFRCGPVSLVVNAEIARRYGSEPVPLAAAFAQSLRDKLSPGLSWGRDEQLVPLGETRDLALKLPAGVTVEVQATQPEVVAVEDMGGGRYRLSGLSRGSCVLIGTASDGRKVPDLPVQVLPWAASWDGGPGRLEFTGPVDAKRVQTSLERWLGAHALPGARVETAVKDTSAEGLWQIQASAKVPGAITVEQTLKVQVEQAPARPMAPAEVLLLSNHPEKIFSEGVLYQRQATAATYRLMWHHRNDPEGVERYVAIELFNPNPVPRKLRLIWSSYGPSADEIHVGHTAALGFAMAGLAGNSETLTLPPNGSRVVEIRRVKTGQTISGVAYLWDETGARLPLEMKVSASLPLSAAPEQTVESLDPGRTASGVFPAEMSTTATHTLGGPFTYIEYGGEPFVRDLDAKYPSYGNFGTMYRTRLMLHNPSDTTGQVYIGFSAPGGAARGVLLLDGTLYDLPMGRSGDGVPVATVALAPGEVRQLDMELFPQAGSNYPIRLVVRSDFEHREREEIPPSAPERPLLP